MMRLILRAMGVLALIFSLVVGVIVAQPHDDAAMRAFFESQECSAPCFLGIRPGVTTTAEAIAILQAHPWVKSVNPAASTFGSGARAYTNIYWGWSGQQPAFVFDAASKTPPYLHIYAGKVQYIRLVTRIPYADAWFVVGAPPGETLIVGSDSAIQSAIYQGGRLVFDAKVVCPMNPAVVWSAPIAITYSDGSLTAYTKPGYHIDRAFFRSTCQS
jgi:hypothetical protein